MIALYLLKKTESKITYEDRVKDENFMPVNVLSEEYNLAEINKNGYIIMPCTYYKGI